MLTEKTGFGSGLLFCLIFALLFGYGLPKLAMLGAKYIGPNGYWGLLFASFLTLPVIYVTVFLGRKFPGRSILELFPTVFGKPLGNILSLICILFLIGLMVWEIRAVVETYRIYFLIRTPLWATTVCFVLSAWYIASKGIEGISRLAAFLFILMLLLILFTLLTSFQGFNTDNIQPYFFFEGEKFLSGTIHLFNPFLPLASLFWIYRYYTKKPQGLKPVLAATGLVTLLFFMIIMGTIGVYGIKKVTTLSWPFMELTKQSQIPIVMQTTGLFFGGIFLIETLISLSTIYFTAADACARLFNRFTYKRFLFILCPLLILITLNLGGEKESSLYFDYLHMIGFYIVFGLPLLLWISVTLFGKRLS